MQIVGTRGTTLYEYQQLKQILQNSDEARKGKNIILENWPQDKVTILDSRISHVDNKPETEDNIYITQVQICQGSIQVSQGNALRITYTEKLQEVDGKLTPVIKKDMSQGTALTGDYKKTTLKVNADAGEELSDWNITS